MTFLSGNTVAERAEAEPRVPSPGHRGFGTTFIVNFGFGSVRGVVFVLNTLIVAPLLLLHLGAERFAIFALITPFLRYGFNGVFDFGFCTGIVRYVSGAAAIGDDESVNRYVTAALMTYAAAATVLLTVFHLVGPKLITVLVSSDPALQPTAELILGRCLLAYVLYLFSNAFFAVTMGAQHLHATHMLGMVSMLIEAGGMLALVHFGLTVERATRLYELNAAIGLVLSACLARYYWPRLRISVSRLSAGAFRELCDYCVKFSVTVSATLIGPVIDKLLLARFAGLEFVAAYEGAARLVEVCKRVTQLITLPLFPMAGAMQRTSSAEQRHALYQRVFAANVPLSAGLFLLPLPFAFPILRLWLGAAVAHSATTAFIVLAITAFLLSLVNPASMTLAGSGRMRLLIITGTSALASNLVTSSALAYYFHFPGVLVGTAVAYGFMALLMLAALQRTPEFAIDISKNLTLVVAAVIFACVPGYLLVTVVGTPSTLPGLGAAMAVVAVLFGLGMMSFAENRKALSDLVGHARLALPSGAARGTAASNL